ncbi:hypothetical protein AVEN_238575-1 [Araneus ventricosus]|uniref:Uncharacterized protein n=1 Tax=Araneus ventricosus TaxID=182803 RepID=A0A4Y2PB93_ARAVE|nr:hypothetical protein AVEN_238575-1 [Araneus ventricosus]
MVFSVLFKVCRPPNQTATLTGRLASVLRASHAKASDPFSLKAELRNSLSVLRTMGITRRRYPISTTTNTLAKAKELATNWDWSSMKRFPVVMPSLPTCRFLPVIYLQYRFGSPAGGGIPLNVRQGSKKHVFWFYKIFSTTPPQPLRKWKAQHEACILLPCQKKKEQFRWFTAEYRGRHAEYKQT